MVLSRALEVYQNQSQGKPANPEEKLTFSKAMMYSIPISSFNHGGKVLIMGKNHHT